MSEVEQEPNESFIAEKFKACCQRLQRRYGYVKDLERQHGLYGHAEFNAGDTALGEVFDSYAVDVCNLLRHLAPEYEQFLDKRILKWRNKVAAHISAVEQRPLGPHGDTQMWRDISLMPNTVGLVEDRFRAPALFPHRSDIPPSREILDEYIRDYQWSLTEDWEELYPQLEDEIAKRCGLLLGECAWFAAIPAGLDPQTWFMSSGMDLPNGAAVAVSMPNEFLCRLRRSGESLLARLETPPGAPPILPEQIQVHNGATLRSDGWVEIPYPAVNHTKENPQQASTTSQS